MQDNRYYITKETYSKLQEEYRRLKLEEKPVVLERVKDSREMGNLEDNQEYEAAREAQNLIEGRILEIEDILENCRIIADDPGPIHGKIKLGSQVTVEVEGRNQTFTITGSIEADPTQGKISHESPVGSKLLGLKVGDVVNVELPHATLEYKVLEIHR